MKRLFISIALLIPFFCSAQVKFSVGGTVHDFGDVLLSDGPLSCSFEFRNTGTEDLVIYSVLSSCGCTNVQWTRENIKAGESGTVSARYDNEEPGPFDKTLTVYVSGVKRPTILHIRGVASKEKRSLKESYPVHFQNALGLRADRFKAGILLQGEVRSGSIKLANISQKEITVSWTDVSANLVIEPRSVTIKPSETASIAYAVNSDKNLWGQNDYGAVPVINGVRSDTGISIYAITRDNFSDVPSSRYSDYAGIDLEPRSVELTFFKGDPRHAGVCFPYKGTGKKDLVIHRIQSGDSRVKPVGATEGKICFDVDAEGLQADESYLYYAYLYTNCPADPVVTLYISVRVL